MKRYALSAIGRDTPGMVATVTSKLYDHGCNIEDSSMTRLEDEFAIILIMSMEEKNEAALGADLKGVEEKTKLTINLKESGTEETSGPESNYIITLHGADTTGIVYKTTELLSGMQVNITDLQTKRTHGEGANIYIMLLEVFVPEGAEPKKPTIEELKERLNRLGTELDVTIKIKPIEEYEPL